MRTIIILLLCFTAPLMASEERARPELKDVFKDEFLIGAALNPAQFCGSNVREAELVKQQFNCISPENELKWERVHPQPGRYDFTLADRYVGFGEQNGMFIIGHNLVWLEQTPDWVFQDAHGQPVSRDILLARMRDHIYTVVGRYRGRIKGWDVVNEALADDGTLNSQSRWLKIIGPDYIEKAYQFAHEADPGAQLYYNDYGMENPAKRAGGEALVRKLQAEGIPITGVGLQGHYGLTWPKDHDLEATIDAFASLGVKVMITELDVDVLPSAWNQGNADVTRNVVLQKKLNPYAEGLPPNVDQALSSRYADLFRIFLKHKHSISRVTFWGVADGDSWLNNWPVNGRTSYPLLFDRNCQPKSAFEAVIRTVRLPGNPEQSHPAKGS